MRPRRAPRTDPPHLVTAPSARRRGIATALFRQGLRGLRAAGIAKCHLMVFHDNADGLAFWRAVGAVERTELALLSVASDDEARRAYLASAGAQALASLASPLRRHHGRRCRPRRPVVSRSASPTFSCSRCSCGDTPRGRRAFRPLARAGRADQGARRQPGPVQRVSPQALWGWWLGSAGSPVKVFFLLCVLVAGLYGAATAHRRILYAGGPGIGRARAGGWRDGGKRPTQRALRICHDAERNLPRRAVAWGTRRHARRRDGVQLHRVPALRRALGPRPRGRGHPRRGPTMAYVRGRAIEFHFKSGPAAASPLAARAGGGWPAPDRRQSATDRAGADAKVPIDHFDGLDTFEDPPRDGRCVADYWF